MKKLFYVSLLLSLAGNTFATTITSSSFDFHNALPSVYTCDGKNQSPQLSWTGLPPETKSLVLIMSDRDAPNGIFYHWIVYNIPGTVTEFEAGMTNLPTGAQAALNTWKKAQYNGPCPPQGTMHHYNFTIYALDSTLTLPANSTVEQVIRAMQPHIVDQATVTATYERK